MLAYLNNLAVLITINAILAVTLNFVLGYAGIFSMAHAVFFGVGAYAATLVAMQLGGGFLLSTAAGMAISALISLALALPALRVRGEYFVAASLGLQMLAITVFSEWKVIRELRRHIPKPRQDNAEVKRMLAYGCATVMHLLPLNAPRLEGEDQSKDIDFTTGGIDARRQAGYLDTQKALAEKAWEHCEDTMDGVIIHDANA